MERPDIVTERDITLGPSRLQKGLIVAATALEMVLLHSAAAELSEPSPELEQSSCYQPTAEDYENLENVLRHPAYMYEPQPSPNQIMFDLNKTAPEPSFESKARETGASIYTDTFDTAMQTIIESTDSGKDYFERREAVKTELFAALQELTLKHYGVAVIFETEPQIISGQDKLTKEKQIIAMPPAWGDMSGGDIVALSREISATPAEFVAASGVTTLKLYKLQADKDGNGAAGYVNGTHTIHMDVRTAKAWTHELGHELDAAICVDTGNDPTIAQLNGNIEVYGDAPDAVVSLETYNQVHGADLDATTDMTDDNYDTTTTYNEALCAVDKAYAEESRQIATASNYHTTVAEDKAEIYKAILTSYQLSDLLVDCRTIIATKTRVILARMRHIAPGATDHTIRNSYRYD